MSVSREGRHEDVPHAPFHNLNADDAGAPQDAWDAFAVSADSAKDAAELRVGRPGNPRFQGSVAVAAVAAEQRASIAAPTAGELMDTGAVVEAGERFAAPTEPQPPVEQHPDVA